MQIKKLKEILAKIRDVFVLIKFRFEMGISFMVFVNFSLLIFAVSDKIQSVWNVSTFNFGLIIVLLALFGTWLFGFFLDKIVKYPSTYYDIVHKKSPRIMQILSEIKEIKEDIKELKIK